jgi:hypothetical protein
VSFPILPHRVLSCRANDNAGSRRHLEFSHGNDAAGFDQIRRTNEMNKMFAGAVVLASLAAATSANAQSADGYAGAKIIAPLEISNVESLYFGTIAPSTSVADSVTVLADGSRKCGPALTCLTADHTAAGFEVTGEADAFYTISLPKEINIVNAKGTAMRVSAFEGSKTGGQLLSGQDSFTVGGTLDVAPRQEAGLYSGQFTVAVEYQ